MTSCYKIRSDLPKIPKELLAGFIGEFKKSNAYYNSIRPVTQNGVQIPPALQQNFKVSDDLTTWITENVSKSFSQISYSTTSGSTWHLPHIDAERRINYMIDPGGPDAELVFFRQGNDCLPADLCAGWRPSRLEDVEPVCNICLAPGDWYEFDASVIHGVRGMSATRKLITVHFS